MHSTGEKTETRAIERDLRRFQAVRMMKCSLSPSQKTAVLFHASKNPQKQPKCSLTSRSSGESENPLVPVISSKCRKPGAVWIWKSNCGSWLPQEDRSLLLLSASLPPRNPAAPRNPHCIQQKILVRKGCLKTTVTKITNTGDAQKNCAIQVCN